MRHAGPVRLNFHDVKSRRIEDKRRADACIRNVLGPADCDRRRALHRDLLDLYVSMRILEIEIDLALDACRIRIDSGEESYFVPDIRRIE